MKQTGDFIGERMIANVIDQQANNNITKDSLLSTDHSVEEYNGRLVDVNPRNLSNTIFYVSRFLILRSFHFSAFAALLGTLPK